MLRFIPREEKYFEMFGEMTVLIESASALLEEMLANMERAEQYVASIKDLEHQCDDLTHAIVIKLNKSFITPSIGKISMHSPARWMTSSTASTVSRRTS